MKPGNIFIDKNDFVTLIDFGIAAEYDDVVFETNQVALTRGYCAPEQYLHRTYDERSDIYSLGVTLYNILTGVGPTDKLKLEPIKKVKPDISPEMEYIVSRATRQHPGERYQSAEDMREDLLHIGRLREQLKSFVLKQASAYAIFAALYAFFISLIVFGASKAARDSLALRDSLTQNGYNNLALYKYPEALADLKAAYELDEKHLASFEGLLIYYYKTAYFTEGINFIKSAKIKETVEDGKILANLYMGKFFYKIDSPRDALIYLKDAYLAKQNNEEIILYLGLALAKTGEPAESYAEKLPEDSKNFLLAHIASQKKDFPSSISYLKKIVENSSSNDIIAEAYLAVADIYKSNPDVWRNADDLYLLSLEESDRALDDEYKNMEILLKKAKSYRDHAKGDEKAAYLTMSIKYFKEALNLGRVEENAHVEIAYLYEDLAKTTGDIDEYDNGAQALKDGLTKYPDSFLLQYHLCVALFEKEFFKGNDKDFTAALDAFSKAKTMVKTQRDREWINALENHIKENVF
jgi:serine/threonine-protein kinase